MSSVSFYNADVDFVLKGKRLLKQFIPSIMEDVGKKLVSLHVIFCSDEYLLALNKQFLQHDYFTDILTFDLSSHTTDIEAEIYISVDRVKENSFQHNVTFQNEMLRIIFHGVLHLSGFGDKTITEKKLMTSKEDQYLKMYSTFHVKQ